MKSYLFWPVLAALAVFTAGVFQRPRVVEELIALTGASDWSLHSAAYAQVSGETRRSEPGWDMEQEEPASDVVRVASSPRPTDRLRHAPVGSSTPPVTSPPVTSHPPATAAWPSTSAPPGPWPSGERPAVGGHPAVHPAEPFAEVSPWDQFGVAPDRPSVGADLGPPAVSGDRYEAGPVVPSNGHNAWPWGTYGAYPESRANEPPPRGDGMGQSPLVPRGEPMSRGGLATRALPAVDAGSWSPAVVDVDRLPVYPSTMNEQPSAEAVARGPLMQGPPSPAPAVADTATRQASAVMDSDAASVASAGFSEIPRAVIENPVFAELVPIQSATQLARVGNDVILGSEVLPIARQAADATLRQYMQSMSAAERRAMTDDKLSGLRNEVIMQYIPMLLAQRIKDKLVQQDAIRNLPREAIDDWNKRIQRVFEDEVLPSLIEDAGASSRAEFEAQLIRDGSSIDTLKRIFAEKQIILQWEEQAIQLKRTVTVDDLLEYYRTHAKEFETPARARWEQLTVRFPSARVRTEAEARTRLAAMGDRVLGGESFADVAKKDSDGVTASAGGARNWTTPGALRSTVIEEAIFGLPVGAMSQILKDQEGLHIVRVVEREDARRKSFEDAQAEIRKKLREQWKEEAKKAYHERIAKEIPVVTIFDEQMAENHADGLPRVPIFQ